MTAPRLAVLVSGSGTILEAMIDHPLPVALVVADRPCRALEVGGSAGVESVLVDRREFGGFTADFARGAFTDVLTSRLVEAKIDLVAMAGFGTIVTDTLHRAFAGRVLNTHPSLLPAFPGWHAVRDALAAGASVTGCTVHVATEALDSGPVLAQRDVAVEDGDDEAALHERIKAAERRLYPEVVARVLEVMAAGGEPSQLSVGSA